MCKVVYLRNKIPKIKDGASVINLDEYKLIGTHLIALCVNGNNVTYFNGFGVECKSYKFIGNKSITVIIYRMEANDSIMWEYFCFGFIGFMFKDKLLWDYTKLFSSNEYEKINKITLTRT